MSCPQGLIVIDYSCGLLQRETGDCIRGLPCPASGECCEINPIAVAILISCSLCCFCCCCALIGFCCYKMCCATTQSSGPSAGMQPQAMQGQQVIVVQQSAPMAGQVQQVDQFGNPIVAPVQQVDQFGNPIVAPTMVDQFGKPVAAQVQSTPGQVDKAGNPIAGNTQANPIDQKNDATGYPVNPPPAAE